MMKFLACNLNHNASNPGHYNKSAYQNHAATHISPVLHLRGGRVQYKQTFSGERKTFGLSFNSNLKKYQYILVIPVNRRVIVNFPPPCGFSRFGFSHKNIVSLSIICIVFVILHLYFTHTFVCGVDRPSDHSQRKISTTITQHLKALSKGITRCLFVCSNQGNQ